MSDTAPGGNGAGTAGTAGTAGDEVVRPEVRMIAQYVKDISFESPRARRSLPQTYLNPEVNVTVNVNAHPLNEDQSEFEVELSLEGQGRKDGTVVFIIELTYGARMEIRNVRPEMKGPLLLVEAPRILFPFARRILADLVRDGGFPQMLLEPVDFAALYRQRVEAAKAAAENPRPV